MPVPFSPNCCSKRGKEDRKPRKVIAPKPISCMPASYWTSISTTTNAALRSISGNLLRIEEIVAVVIGVSLMIARRTASVVIKKPSFWLLGLGAASSSVCGYGVAGWLPLFFMRSFDLTLKQTSIYYSGIALIGGILGIWLGGMIADKLSKKGKGAYPLTPAIAFLISAPCFILAMNSPWLIGLVLPGGGSHTQQLVLAFLIFLLPTGLNLAWLGPITAAVQHLVPAAMRSTASALFLLLNNLLGIAVVFGAGHAPAAPVGLVRHHHRIGDVAVMRVVVLEHETARLVDAMEQRVPRIHRQNVAWRGIGQRHLARKDHIRAGVDRCDDSEQLWLPRRCGL